MNISFNRPVRRRLRPIGCVAAALAAAAFGCTRQPAGDGGAAMRAGVAEVIGALKLVRQEYGNAVAPEGGKVIDATEYAETELFAEQAQAKFATVAAVPGGPDPARAKAIADGLTRLHEAVVRTAPQSDIDEQSWASLTLLEELLAGAIPETIRGTVLAVNRADQAIATEEIVGEYRIGLTTGPPRSVFVRRGSALFPVPKPPAGAAYVGVVVRERRTKRFLLAGTVTMTLDGAGGQRELTLPELWGDFHQYGANVALPGDGAVTITVHVSPPAYARHGDMLTHFVQPAKTTVQGVVRQGALTFDARPVMPPDGDYTIGDDLLQALAEAGTLRDAGEYRVGLIVEGPEPIWIWHDGAPVLQAVANGATNHVEVVLLDRDTGQLVPDAEVSVTFLAGDRLVGNAALHPLLSVFSHYGETLAVPPGTTTVRIHVNPPALGALDRPRLVDPADIDVPLPTQRGKTA